MRWQKSFLSERSRESFECASRKIWILTREKVSLEPLLASSLTYGVTYECPECLFNVFDCRAINRVCCVHIQNSLALFYCRWDERRMNVFFSHFFCWQLGKGRNMRATDDTSSAIEERQKIIYDERFPILVSSVNLLLCYDICRFGGCHRLVVTRSFDVTHPMRKKRVRLKEDFVQMKLSYPSFLATILIPQPVKLFSRAHMRRQSTVNVEAIFHLECHKNQRKEREIVARKQKFTEDWTLWATRKREKKMANSNIVSMVPDNSEP